MSSYEAKLLFLCFTAKSCNTEWKYCMSSMFKKKYAFLFFILTIRGFSGNRRCCRAQNRFTGHLTTSQTVFNANREVENTSRGLWEEKEECNEVKVL